MRTCDGKRALLLSVVFSAVTKSAAWLGTPLTTTKVAAIRHRHRPTFWLAEYQPREPSHETEEHWSSSHFAKGVTSISLAVLLQLSSVAVPPPAAIAYELNDYASETVQNAVQSVQSAVGDTAAMIKAYENIAEIITEGKGVGGEINFKGVQLDRGYISDEDTAIYNPGLTLLTESEKDRLVNAIVLSKKASKEWTVDTEAGYSFLRDRLDPLHMFELRGYLQVVPFYGAALYLVALAVQQISRDLFPATYIACAVAVFVPIVVLVLLGP